MATNSAKALIQRRGFGSLLWARDMSQFATGYSAVTPKSLDSILKLDGVQHKSPDELTYIWNQYHLGRGHISAVMNTLLYNAFQQRARECPMFVLPLRKDEGYVNIFLQAQMPYLLFTGLEDYKARGGQASPYLTVSHYTEFAESKGVVLVRGDVVLPSMLNDVEAKTLLEFAHSFYLRESRYRLVKAFNKNSEDFNFKDVVKELDYKYI